MANSNLNTANQAQQNFIPVTNISGVPATIRAKSELNLSGTVEPSNATNKTIEWSVVSAGTAGAVISGNILNTTAKGTIMVRATINNGMAAGANYTQIFKITVSKEFIRVTNISGIPATITTDTPLTLSGTVAPVNATNKIIKWSVESIVNADENKVEATIINGNALNVITKDNLLHNLYVGTDYQNFSEKDKVAVKVKAVIENGKSPAEHYTQSFNIIVELPCLPKKLEDVIGIGYDLAGKYASDEDNYRKLYDGSNNLISIMDIDKLCADGLIVQDKNLKLGEFESVSGVNLNDYARDCVKKVTTVGVVTGFKKEIEEMAKNLWGVSEIKNIRDDYSFATAKMLIVKDAYYVTIRNKPESLREYLDPVFAADLMNSNMAAKELVAKYGTHVMLGGVLGGRFEYNMSAQRNMGVQSKMSKHANKRAKVIFLENGNTATVDAENANYYVTGTLKPSTKSTPKTNTKNIENKSDYENWLASIEDGNIKWIDYYPNSLVPIYELTADYARSNDIMKYFTTHFKEMEIGGSKEGHSEPFDLGRIMENDIDTQWSNPCGDKDIYSQNGRSTDWSLTVSIREDYSSLNSQTLEYERISVSYIYTVKEMQKDWTMITLTGTKKLTPKRKFLEIKSVKDYVYLSGTIEGKKHGWNDVGNDVGSKKEYLTVSEVKIDDKGKDVNKVGFHAKLNVEFSCLKS